MAQILQCYDFINQMWANCQNVYVISDFHFDDSDMQTYCGHPSAEEKIKIINSTLGKNDCLVCLGDIGSPRYVAQIRARTKILITGNHDQAPQKEKWQFKGIKYDTDKYTKQEAIADAKKKYPGWHVHCEDDECYQFHQPFTFWYVQVNNYMWNYVFQGPLTIGEKVILSHEPVDVTWAYNIHGHTHDKDWQNDNYHLCLCAEKIGFKPIRLKDILEGGCLKGITSLHRQTIDYASRK